MVLDNLRTEMDSLDDRELDYVIARSKTSSDSKALKDSGIASSTFYSWEESKREKLNSLAQKFKRETAMRVLMIMQEHAEKAAKTVAGLMDSRNENIKLKSSQEVLDRSVGKTAHALEVTGTDGKEITLRVIYDRKGLPDE